MDKRSDINPSNILLVEICNFDDFPIGGYLSFAKQMLSAFGNQLALVGMVSDIDTPLGVWIKKEFKGIEYDFFAVKRTDKISKKGLIPERLKVYFAVRKHRKQILSKNIDNLFIQTPEVLLALGVKASQNICCRIPGLENPLSISRYRFSKYLATIFEKVYFSALKNADIIFATGDNVALQDFRRRSAGILEHKNIIKFPSRIDTKIFEPIEKKNARKRVGWDFSQTYIITSGRLSRLKGWKFLLDCFSEFKKVKPDSHFVFLGDGEDRQEIIEYAELIKISKSVIILGRVNHEELSVYLNAADLFVMGSFVEGWSTALVEAISCAKPVVCTNFSSAEELIVDGYNGYVVKNRVFQEFTSKMLNCLELPQENLLSKSFEMKKYSTLSLKENILNYWKLK